VIWRTKAIRASVALVVDASIAVQWFVADERNALAEMILERITAEGAYVPALFRWEIENVLLSAERAGRIDPDDVDTALDTLRDLPIDMESAGQRFFSGREVRLARHYDLTAYDAAYLALASSRRLPLATADAALSYAARDLEITVIEQ